MTNNMQSGSWMRRLLAVCLLGAAAMMSGYTVAAQPAKEPPQIGVLRAAIAKLPSPPTPLQVRATIDQAVRTNPALAPQLVAAALQLLPTQAQVITNAGIFAFLQVSAPGTSVTGIVEAAVQAAPSRSIDIVRGAIIAAPSGQAATIASTAVAAAVAAGETNVLAITQAAVNASTPDQAAAIAAAVDSVVASTVTVATNSVVLISCTGSPC